MAERVETGGDGRRREEVRLMEAVTILLDAGQKFPIYSRKSLKDSRWERT